MVCRGSPDPPRESYEENFAIGDTGNTIAVNASSDSDEEEQGHEGYELLSTVSNDIPDSESEQSEDESHVHVISGAVGVQRENVFLPSVEASETEQVWAAPRVNTGSSPAGGITMDTEQVDQVKAAMAKITLPSSAVPSWAAAVPEDQWRATLMERLKELQGGQK